MTVKRSNISWTDYSGGDANFVIRGRVAGDCEVSPGCAHCYAGAILRRNSRTSERTAYYPDKLARLARTVFVPGETPYRRGVHARPTVFVCDMGDLFHEAVPDWFILDALGVMAYRDNIDWQVLTKRPVRMVEMVRMYGGWPANVWAGVTVEDQARADERIPLLAQVPAVVRFLSMEPLLGPVYRIPEGVNWIIVGGESGPKRRPFGKSWAGYVRDWCVQRGVPFFYKQGAALRPGQDTLLDGRLWQQYPDGDA